MSRHQMKELGFLCFCLEIMENSRLCLSAKSYPSGLRDESPETLRLSLSDGKPQKWVLLGTQFPNNLIRSGCLWIRKYQLTKEKKNETKGSMCRANSGRMIFINRQVQAQCPNVTDQKEAALPGLTPEKGTLRINTDNKGNQSSRKYGCSSHNYSAGQGLENGPTTIQNFKDVEASAKCGPQVP